MTNFEQIQNMKESLYHDLADVIDKHRVHIGAGLMQTDVIGVIEMVKLEYFINGLEG